MTDRYVYRIGRGTASQSQVLYDDLEQKSHFRAHTGIGGGREPTGNRFHSIISNKSNMIMVKLGL